MNAVLVLSPREVTSVSPALPCWDSIEAHWNTQVHALFLWPCLRWKEELFKNGPAGITRVQTLLSSCLSLLPVIVVHSYSSSSRWGSTLFLFIKWATAYTKDICTEKLNDLSTQVEACLQKAAHSWSHSSSLDLLSQAPSPVLHEGPAHSCPPEQALCKDMGTLLSPHSSSVSHDRCRDRSVLTAGSFWEGVLGSRTKSRVLLQRSLPIKQLWV